MMGDRVTIKEHYIFIRWDALYLRKFALALLGMIFLSGCDGFESKWSEKDSMQAPIIKCVRVNDHYETTYQVKVDEKRTYNTTFDTNVWMKPGEYNTKIYWYFPKNSLKPMFGLNRNLAYEKRSIDAGDKIYEATVIKVIELHNCWAVRLQWKEDDGKFYEVTFEIDTNVFEGNKMLIVSDGKLCNLVAAHMKHYDHSSSSDNTMLFMMMGAM
jgi:hypothetical protein